MSLNNIKVVVVVAVGRKGRGKGYWKGRPLNLSNRLSEGVITGERGFGIDLFSPFSQEKSNSLAEEDFPLIRGQRK